MSKETIFNIYPIFQDQHLVKIGFRVHEKSGTDQEKIDFLLSRIEIDRKEMAMIDMPENFKVRLQDGTEFNGLTHERFNMLLNNGTEGILYEPIFQLFKAPTNPLTISTPIVDGEIKIDRRMEFPTEISAPFTEQLLEEVPNYYLAEFLTDEGFNLIGLIDKDFFEAIRLLFNNHHFVSTAKLLMSAIDSIAFLEYGDISNKVIFKEWMNEFCDLSNLGITLDELWEYRNSMLHMTNSYSRKVINKKVNSVQFYVSFQDEPDFKGDVETKYFNLKTLISIVSDGVFKWSDSFNTNRDKFRNFVDRYDLITSDSRYNKVFKEKSP